MNRKCASSWATESDEILSYCLLTAVRGEGVSAQRDRAKLATISVHNCNNVMRHILSAKCIAITTTTTRQYSLHIGNVPFHPNIALPSIWLLCSSSFSFSFLKRNGISICSVSLITLPRTMANFYESASFFVVHCCDAVIVVLLNPGLGNSHSGFQLKLK